MKHSEQDVRTRILETAKKLFAQQGFEATSVRQICEEAEANIALVSYYFGGKEKVFYAIFDHYFPSTNFLQNVDQLVDPVEGIRYMIHEVVRFRKENVEMMTLIQREILGQTPRREGLQPYILPLWSKLRSLLEKGRAQEHYQFHSTDLALMFVLGVILFPGMTPFIQPILKEKETKLEEMIEETERFVFRGLGYKLDDVSKRKHYNKK